LERAVTALLERMLNPERPRLAEVITWITGVDPTPIVERMQRAEPKRTWRPHVELAPQNGLACAARIGAVNEYGGGSWARVERLAVADPVEAWEVVTQRLNLPGWVDYPRRGFYRAPYKARCDCESAARRRCEQCAGTGFYWRQDDELPRPPTLAALIAFASCPQAVVDAEAVGREIAAALDARAPRAVWRVDAAWSFGGNVPAWMWARIHARGLGEALLRTGCAIHDVDDAAVTLVMPAVRS
jgi:hypothetical protein